MLFGFSQGAQVAFEVAFKYPDLYKGALVLSPGTKKSLINVGLRAGEKNKAQGYVLMCGEGEATRNVTFTRRDADLAQQSRARVRMLLVDGQKRHTFPEDFMDRFVERIQFILGTPAAK